MSWCPYTFGASNASSTLGSAISQAAAQSLQVQQMQNIASVPDTMQNTTVQALCNACNAAAHEETACANRIRTFDIHGSICVEENIKFQEIGEARERAQGASEKLGVCVVSNEGSDSTGALGSLAYCANSSSGSNIGYSAPATALG